MNPHDGFARDELPAPPSWVVRTLAVAIVALAFGGVAVLVVAAVAR